MTCVVCGDEIEPVLARLGSTTCMDHRHSLRGGVDDLVLTGSALFRHFQREDSAVVTASSRPVRRPVRRPVPPAWAGQSVREAETRKAEGPLVVVGDCPAEAA